MMTDLSFFYNSRFQGWWLMGLQGLQGYYAMVRHVS